MEKGPRVIRYRFMPSGRFLFVVQGRHHDYLTTLSFCTCYDYSFRRRPEGCVHMRALRAAMETGEWEEIVAGDEEFSQIFKYEVLDVLSEEPR
ncbi:MAG: hypothetical protein ACP5LW_05900 [Nitrososphaeria archaeon]